jgi:ATP-dependent protease ClpP protease subunit
MARINKDRIDRFFDYSLDSDSRTIYLGCAAYCDSGDGNGVDFYMTERLIKGLHLLESAAPNGDQPITIIANSPGGSWFHGMAQYGAIKNCRNQVIIKMYGHAMSMGSIIPQAADERLIDANASFMIHYGSDAFHGHSKIMSKVGDIGKKINHMMENIYLDRMMEKDEEMTQAGFPDHMEITLSEIIHHQQEMDYPKPPKPKYRFSKEPAKRREEVRKILKELLNFDSYLSAQEAVDLGFADEIIL